MVRTLGGPNTTSIGQLPGPDFAIASASDDGMQIGRAFSQGIDTIGVARKSRDKRLSKDAFNFSRIQRSVVFSSLLKGM